MKHFGKLQLIVILLICGVLWGYDNHIFSGARDVLKDTYIVDRSNILNALGNQIEIEKYEDSNTFYWKTDISNEKLLTICEEYDSTIDTHNITQTKKLELLINNNIGESNIGVCKITLFKEKKYSKILNLKTPTSNCKFNPSTDYFSCLHHEKDIIVYNGNTGEEISRYTYIGGGPGSNFEKMEWMSDHELALYDDGWKSSYENNILRMNVNTGEVTEVCDSNVSNHLREGVLKEYSNPEDITCSDTSEFEALFGSKKWPVSNLFPSAGPADDRFYFYSRWIDSTGIYNGKEWTEGYDRKTGDTFYVSTNDSVLKGIFGDLFIVDWFGWSWF